MDAVLQGFLFGFALNAPIGPTSVEVNRRGFTEGLKSQVFFLLGNVVIFSLYFVLIIFGFSFISQVRVFNMILFAFGVLVLFYLSLDAFRDFLSTKEIEIVKKNSSSNSFVAGLLLSLGNPALFIILMGLLGADLSNHPASLSRALLLALGMYISYVIFFAGFITLIQIGRKYLHKRYLRYVSLMASIVLFYFSIKFGYKLMLLL